MNKLDVIVFTAHPDDAELAMGGTIAKLTSAGVKVGIIDLSEAQLSTRGTIPERRKESEKASGILGISLRENLKLHDGSLKPDNKSTALVVSKIRKYKPKIIFAPYFNDRHPDHIGTSHIVKEAMFFSGLAKYKTSITGKEQKAYRPYKLYYFMHAYEFIPTFVVDISNTFDKKMKSIKAYSSQFYDPGSKEPETFISQPNFLKFIEARAKVFGFQIGKDYAEPFYCEEKIEYDLINQIKNL